MPVRRRHFAMSLAALIGLAAPSLGQEAPSDPLQEMQNDYVEHKDQRADRAYHFGAQGAGDVFSNHTSHGNRMVPVYVFGTKADLSSVTGENSRYRDASKIKELFGGRLPEHTVNPKADYADQSDLNRVQKDAIKKGAKYVFTVWFDGTGWPVTRAAAVAKTGQDYAKGPGSGLVFQDYDKTPRQYGYVVTTPTHASAKVNVDKQTVTVPEDSLTGGYDPEIAGPTPWTEGKYDAPGYLKGQSGTKAEKARVLELGRSLHAYTDSSTSAAEYASGVKSFNGSVNVDESGRCVPTLFNILQSQGWKVGTVTSVPFDHASPAAMYAHNVSRNDYQDLARDMLGLDGIGQKLLKDDRHPGLDVVIGTGYGQMLSEKKSGSQGKNAKANENMYIADADLKAADVAHGGQYVVVTTQKGKDGSKTIQKAAEKAAKQGHKLFGFFGTSEYHLPFQTADGDYKPAKGIHGRAEKYDESDLLENPTLAEMTRAALTVLTTEPGKPFALFVEAGDVDSGLHDNNLDNAIGALYSGEDAIRVILDWVEQNSNWDESVLIVTSDHTHYLVLDHPEALSGAAHRDKK